MDTGEAPVEHVHSKKTIKARAKADASFRKNAQPWYRRLLPLAFASALALIAIFGTAYLLMQIVEDLGN